MVEVAKTFFEFLEETKDEISWCKSGMIQGKIQQVVFLIGQPKEKERRAEL
jgi:hypothetical protein